jgi:tetratricopeptide (TPR) repeat protein
LEACLNFGIQIADGLNHAHQRGIVHSDLKPANVLIADDGRPMILDFNLAVDHRDARDNPVGGTLPYMSPEQLASLSDKESSQRPATDIYSLGVMLFELLVAQKPFPFRPGAVDKALQYMIADRKAVPSLRSLSPELPVGLCRVVEKCLAFEPAARYQSAAQVRDDLYRQLTNQPLSEVSEPLAERIQKAYRRSPRFAWGVMTVVLGIALAGALAAYSIQSSRAERNATLATVRQFESDATWLSSALSVSQIDAEERVGDWKRAETWIAKFDERRMPSTDRYLSPEQRRGIDRKLSELQYAMGSVRTKQAKSAADSKSREDLLLEALVLNEQAGTRLSSVPNALLSQREDILAMLGRSDSDQIADGNDEDDSQQPKSAWQKRLIGMNLLDHGRAKAAIELFERSDGLQKNYADWAQLGNAYAMRRNPDQAVECFTACIALRPEIPFGYFQRGRAHMDAKQYARAARDFELFLKLRPNSYSALGQHAAALTQLGRLSEARDQINIALLQKSDNANLHLLAAEIHHQLGNKELAKQSLGEAASLAAPDDARDFLANGMALLRDGKFQRAHDAFRLAHDSQPTSIAAIKNIAYVLSDHLHRLDEAIVWIDRALKLDPESAELISTKAVLLARSGNAGESREAMNEALRLDNDVTTLLRAASVYAITKANAQDVTTSIEYTRRAMILDPAWASYIAEDPDLVGVRGDERFKEVIKAAMTLRERTH